MRRETAVTVIAVFVCAGIAYAADTGAEGPQTEFGKKTVNTIADTAKSAVSGTNKIAEDSVSDTIAAPGTAMQAVKDTANTALKGTDAAMKSLTGEDR